MPNLTKSRVLVSEVFSSNRSHALENKTPDNKTPDNKTPDNKTPDNETYIAIAFIDPAVKDCQHLASAALPGTEVIVLDGSRDGIDQISEAISWRYQLRAIHIICCGSPGCLQLGSSEVSIENLEEYTGVRCGLPTLRDWSDSLAKGAPILLYGSSIAEGKIGTKFIKRFARLTGASVLASAKPTGSKALGADWELEVSTKKFTAPPLAFDAKMLASYKHSLEQLPVAS